MFLKPLKKTRNTCFIGFKNTRLRLVFLNPIKHCCSCFNDCTKHRHRRALLFIDNRQFIGFLHKQNNYRLKPIVTYWTLKKRQALLTIKAKLKLAIIIIFFLFSLLGREDSAEILSSVWQEEKNFEVLKRCYIQIIYPTSF